MTRTSPRHPILRRARGVLASLAVLAALALLAACGNAQAKAARSATYTAPSDELWTGVVDAVRATHEIDAIDADAYKLRTVEAWFDADGSRPSRDANDSLLLGAGAVRLGYVVALEAAGGAGGAWRVVVTPVAAEVQQGSPQPRALVGDDPAMPAWVESRVDDLYVAIHQRLSAPAAK